MFFNHVREAVDIINFRRANLVVIDGVVVKSDPRCGEFKVGDRVSVVPFSQKAHVYRITITDTLQDYPREAREVLGEAFHIALKNLAKRPVATVQDGVMTYDKGADSEKWSPAWHESLQRALDQIKAREEDKS